MKNLYIGLKIKELRKSHKLSQSRFGNKIGISDRTVSAYETGRCLPSLEVLQKINKIYRSNIYGAENEKITVISNKLKDIKRTLLEIESSIGR